MRFEVRAYGNGAISSVVVEALNLDDALRQVSAMALRPINARPVSQHVAFRLRPRNEQFETLLFAQELLALLEAGLSIIETIEALAEREKNVSSRNIIEQLAGSLREGKSLAGALEILPEVFPALFVGIVRSAERTGSLQEALGRYIDYRRRVDGLRNKVVNAAIYPIILLIVALGVTLFLGGYVVPRFAAVYQGAGRQLPWASEMLLLWGNFARAHVAGLVSLLALIGIAIAWGVRSLSKRGGMSILVRRIPLFSEQARIYETSRLFLTLGMLLDSGLPILTAVGLTEASLPQHQRNSLQEASAMIRTGERLSVAFERTGLTTSVGLRMLRVGEESGRLGEMMTRTAQFHDEEVGRWIERFSRVAEPSLMVGIGLVIGTIVVLLYMPVFDLAGSLR